MKMFTDEIDPKEEWVGGKKYFVAYRGVTRDLKDPVADQYYEFDSWYTSRELRKSTTESIYGIKLSHDPIDCLIEGDKVFKCLIPEKGDDTSHMNIRTVKSTSKIFRVNKFFITSTEVDFNELWEEIKNEQKTFTLCAHRSNFDPHRYWDELNDLQILNVCSSGNNNFYPHEVWNDLSEGQINNLCHSFNPNFYPHSVWDELTETQKTILCARGNPNFYPHDIWDLLGKIQKKYVIRSVQSNFKLTKVIFKMEAYHIGKYLLNRVKKGIKNKVEDSF